MCGKCCWIRWKGKKKKCKHLVRLGKRTLCRTYKTRLGKLIGKIDEKKVYCIERKDSKFDYVGCPLNTDKEVLETEVSNPSPENSEVVE